MFDTSDALADMAQQIRNCRTGEGLTLQQLAGRSGVAASTIHKVEAQQMVPTVAVLLKIAKGLGRRPDELIRDAVPDVAAAHAAVAATGGSARAILPARGAPAPDASAAPNAAAALHDSYSSRPFGVWRIDLDPHQSLPSLELEPAQSALLLVDQGAVQLETNESRVQIDAGDCFQVKGGRIHSPASHPECARLTLIASPPGNLDQRLGRPGRPGYAKPDHP